MRVQDIDPKSCELCCKIIASVIYIDPCFGSRSKLCEVCYLKVSLKESEKVVH